jgi:hypothetical protein
MNDQMAYLLGMVTGNGEIKRGNKFTTISISIPHKNQRTFDDRDVKIYVKASIADIRSIIEPLVGSLLQHTQRESETTLYFEKPNEDYLVREIVRFCDNSVSHETIRVHSSFFSASKEEIISFLRGFSDVTGYIRESNYAFTKPFHRVYLEVPHNWYLVIDICNLLKLVDIPVQNIDWAHPNMRDGNLVKSNQGNNTFWKKEHQIKIFANEFLPIGFGIIHKGKALEHFANELIEHYTSKNKDAFRKTHKFYWELTRKNNKVKPIHPSENDPFIPVEIRGNHYNTWKEIASDLGYHK